jgi:glycosyltransferase involved in cell wall biosynthesis
MKVIISAYACQPRAGSEPGAGWSWARAAALAGHRVWLVTRENNRGPIEDALSDEPELPITPVYLDLPARLRWWKKGQRGVRLYYVLWQRLVRRTVSELHALEDFDVAHHLTFAVDWLPAGAVGVPGLPAVWGPIGGAGSVPPALYRWLGLSGVGQELLRESLVRPLRRVFGDHNARRARLVVAQNEDVAARFARRCGQVVVEPNVALEGHLPRTLRCEVAGRRTVVFVGRLIPWKGLRLALAVVARLPADWRIIVIGDGPERRRGQRLATTYGISHRVDFRGHRPREEVLATMSDADVLLLPSMHDSAGWVVGEAAASGIPTVCLRLGGPATMVLRSGGDAVKPRSEVVADLADAVEQSIGKEVVRDAWSRDRLPELVDAWYRYATDASSPCRPQV